MTDDSIYLLKDSGNLEKVKKSPYDTENLLQVLIEKYPELLAGDQINQDEPVRWMLIKREAGVPDGEALGDRWSVDHLLLDQNGIPTFVETKRSSDTRIRREIVGQMLDYAANSQKYWSVERIRAMAISQYSGPDKADSIVADLIGDEPREQAEIEVESFWAKVNENLRNGHVRLMFVADKLPGELRRVIEFLNEQMTEVEVLGIELPQFVGSDFKALVPRLIGQTEIIRQKKQEPKTSSRKTTMDEFISKVMMDFRPFFTELILKAKKHGMEIYWGTKGFSLRVKSKSGKLLSLFYCLPPGSNDRDVAYIQGYVGYIEDEAMRANVRRRFLDVEGTTAKGEYTIDLELSLKTLEAARKMVEVLWEVKTQFE
jgi:hypothetical protein